MMKSAVAATLIGAAAAGSINLAIQDCGDSATHGHVTSISPTSVPQGSKTRVVGSGSLDEQVTAGTFNAQVKALGVTLTTCSGDFCAPKTCDLPQNTGSIALQGLSCPQAAGDVSIDFDVTVSASIPSALAVLEIDLTAASGSDKLLCAKINTSPGLEDAAHEEGGNVNLSFEDCGDASTVGTITDLQPRSLTLGGTTTIVGSGTLKQDVPAGDFSFTAKALGVTVLSDGGDLCADKDIKLPLGVGSFNYKSAGCPVKAGDVTLTFDATLAGSIPSQIAKLDISVAAKGSDGTKALCATIHTTPGLGAVVV